MSEIRDPGQSAHKFSSWLTSQVINDARGEGVGLLDVKPDGRFWLGSLVSEEFQMRMDRGDRGERMDPCSMGIRVQPVGDGPWNVEIRAEFRVWTGAGEEWKKSEQGTVRARINVANQAGVCTHLESEIAAELERISGSYGLSASLRSEIVHGLDRDSLELTLVNTSPESIDAMDSRLYEVVLRVGIEKTEPYLLESLPDSFRYDRRVPAYGVNVGVIETEDGHLITSDVLTAEQDRPSFWNTTDPEPDLTFATLAEDPLPSLQSLVDAHDRWGSAHWSDEALAERARSQNWDDEIWSAVRSGRAEFEVEHERMQQGLVALEANDQLRRTFQLMNEAMSHSSRGRYSSWRPFQIGFILAVCPAIATPEDETDFADVVWFATGGGKTETYLGLVVMAALHDRIIGKTTGVTAWARFPLRLLSLQQTQRFADALGGAELVRQKENLGGDVFSLGFLIGDSSTPNRIEEDPADDWKPDPEDPEMPARYRVLLECPFCFLDGITMSFDHEFWTLDHRCGNDACPWGEGPLPFYVVDDEIYRNLPTVIVGTLDKIALIAIQTSMAGLFGPPRGFCSGERHGHTYAKRSKKPNGCLVPGCERPVEPLPMARERYGPMFRLQDELHLLRDALGAVNAHYEGLIDHLQLETTGTRAKILGSSATLSGYEHQVDVLYRREARVFPAQGPSVTDGFWTASSGTLARRHLALAPRGATLEFANDRIVTILQQSIRRLRDDPVTVCSAAGVPAEHAAELLSLYGTTVVYGNTIRDLDAAARSLETQVPVEGPLNTANLTGQTPFEDVRAALDRLQNPEDSFDDRIHVVTASSMMSHGVDVDRLNVMIVLGLPLTTAEYIQTTARIGRSWPGTVFVLHKMARERDASTLRAWGQFVTQGDRFVEPIPITRRSVRVLERTAPGLFLARLLHVHEPKSSKALTTVKNLKRYVDQGGLDIQEEVQAMQTMLGLDSDLDVKVREEIERWVETYFDLLEEPPSGTRFPGDLCPGGRGAMMSLRDVELQAPVQELLDGGGR